MAYSCDPSKMTRLQCGNIAWYCNDAGDRGYFPSHSLLDGWQEPISLKGAGIQNSWRSMTHLV